MLNFVFLRSDFQDAPLLGRTVKEHMFASLGVEEAKARIVGQFEEEPEPECAYLTLDMPLVTLADIERVAERMRAKGIGELRLGGDASAARIILSRGSKGYFSNDEAFLQIVDAKSYSMVYNLLRSRIIDGLVARGVCVPYADGVVVDSTATVQAGAKLLPFSRIEGASLIAAGAVVSSSLVRDSSILEGASVEMSHIADSVVGAGASVGPFARLRGASIAANCRVGDFVEVKASSLGEGAKAAHLAYIGDAEVGARTNVGCGAVFCNFDGKRKHRTEVGADCFIGANANLVAPLSVGDGAFIAAGTTVTEDVGAGTFTIGRSRQTTKSG